MEKRYPWFEIRPVRVRMEGHPYREVVAHWNENQASTWALDEIALKDLSMVLSADPSIGHRVRMDEVIDEPLYHAPDCDGSACDGCGWIDAEGNWHAGPCPEVELPYQADRAQ
jgi:hypothetical protein